MKRTTLIAILLVCIIGSAISVYGEEAAPSLNVSAKAALLMEPTTGKIMLEQNAHEQLPPASVTKVMTILLIYEAVDNEKIKWDDIVTVSDHAAGMGGSQIYLEPMEQQTVRDLTKAIVVSSANDAAVSMAEFIAGSEDGFVIQMNQKAKSLGMNDTHFINACGLDTDGHITSAHDIAVMSRELITKYPEVFDFTKIWMDTIIHKTARGEEEFGLSNTNRLIKSYNGATGLKTGSTGKALYCISATAERDGMQLISVILGAPDPNTRFHEAMRMLDYGFANFNLTKGDPAATPMGTVKVFKGRDDEVEVVVKSQITCLVPKGKNVVLEPRIELVDALNAPVEEGTKAGEIIYFQDGTEVGRSDLVTSGQVERAGMLDILGRVFIGWFKE